MAGNQGIIIVDDEPIVTSTLKNLLAIEGDYEPTIFNSPKEALEYIKTAPVDLVISDFLMPEMNGIEFLSEVKKLSPGATLILLTGYADKENAIRAINEVGIYRYLEKPWDNSELHLCIKNGLERSHLIENLNSKIKELSDARERLKIYNEQLEKIVQERTIDLSNANQKLSAIINHCADGIVAVQKDGKILQINPIVEKLCGLTKEEILNTNFNGLFVGLSEPICSGISSEKDVLLRDYRIYNHKKAKSTPVEVSFAPVKDVDSENEKFFVGVIRDITAQEEMNRLRDDFIATLTHDLRTPLLAAIQTLGFFLDGSLGELNDRQKLLLETMLHSNQDMLGLVNALLEVYKYESGKLVLCKDNFELNQLIYQCVDEVQSLIQKKEISLSVNTDEDVKVNADKQELRRVLSNLLGNAINYTESGGKINISVTQDSENVLISVEDNGIGIPKEDIPHIFKRFSQGTSKKRSTGTGLGLYLSRQIVEAHDGKIWLESEVGKGSKFYFTIPKLKTVVTTGLKN